MSTTHIQPLPNVYGRMVYTELGEGKKRTENIQNGTNRIAAQMGDGDSREEFVRFCSAMKRKNQGRENEGFEVRVSWAPRGAVQGRPRGHPARLRVRLPAVQGEGGTQRPVLGHGPHRRRGRLRARPRHHREPRFGDGQCHRARHRPRHGQAQERPAEQADGLLRGGSPAGRAEDEMGGPKERSSSRALSSACRETASRKPATRRPAWTSSARSLGCAAWS